MMAAEASLLPMDISSLLDQDPTSSASGHDLQNDSFLQELFTTDGGVDLLTSVLDSSEGAQYPTHAQPLVPTLDFETLLNFPTSPAGSTSYASETSSVSNCNQLPSPVASLGAGSASDQPGAESPSHSPLVTSTFSDPSQWSPTHVTQEAAAEKRNSGSEFSAWSASPSTHHQDALTTGTRSVSPPSSTDVRIDVESLRQSTAVATPPSPPTSSSDRKAATLVLTDEEKRLLSEEGISLPTDMPLTKAEQKQLKRIQRKIKNKVSAQESRKRKKEYVEGLEDRVKLSTQKNQQLVNEVDRLQTENQSLMKQLKELQELVGRIFPSKLQAGTAGTMLMVVVLSFSLFVLPPGEGNSYAVSNAYARQSRTLLFTATDEFGNVVDPNTGKIISVAGGHTPLPLPPWLDQTPAILQWMNRTRTRLAETRLYKTVFSSRVEAEGAG